MRVNILTSQEFVEDVNSARCLAETGPVFIADDGQPTHVLLTIDEFERIFCKEASIVDLLAMPGAADIEFEAPCLGKIL